MIFALPYRTDSPAQGRAAITLALTLAGAGVYVWQVAGSGAPWLMGLLYTGALETTQSFVLWPSGVLLGIKPDGTTVAGLSRWAPLLTSMIVHANVFHVAVNLIYFWIFGRSVEGRLGAGRYAALYVVGGMFATGAHLWVRGAESMFLLGASGAIAAVLGAHVVFYPTSWVRVFVFFIAIVRFPRVPAWFFIALWFFLLNQVVALLDNARNDGGVATWAHIVGFLFGVVWASITRLVEGRTISEDSEAP